MSGPPTIGILGLGEAGTAIAADLVAAGARVIAWDPASPPLPAGVEGAGGEREVAADADAVLSLNSAAVAREVAASAAPALRGGSVYADLNTAAPELKRDLAGVIGPRGAAFADVALMAPVPGRGLRTPALASGPGAERFVAILGGLGMPVAAVGAEPGAAAARKLARSVFTKGMAAAIGESLAAGERLGCEEWLYADIERTLVEADPGLVRRLVEGSPLHAERRIPEMAAAAEMLRELELEPRIAAATEAWLRELAEAKGAKRKAVSR